MSEKRDKEHKMQMDLDGRSTRSPIRLVEPKPFPKDDRGRPIAMDADRDETRRAPDKPFVLEEPEPETIDQVKS